MDELHRLRFAGLNCIAGAVLWMLGLLFEYGYRLFSASSGPPFVFDQIMFALTVVGYILGILGLLWAQASRKRWSGRITRGLFLAGWCALLLALAVSLCVGRSTPDLLVMGGFLGNLGGLLAGSAIVLAQRWCGWRRFRVLIFGLYCLFVIVLPISIVQQEPTLITASGWAVAWLLIGSALYSSATANQLAQNL